MKIQIDKLIRNNKRALFASYLMFAITLFHFLGLMGIIPGFENHFAIITSIEILLCNVSFLLLTISKK